MAVTRFWAGVLLLALGGCATAQVRTTAMQMVEDVAAMREQQALRNIAAAIDDRDFVPSQIFLGDGAATGQSTATAALKLPQFDFSMPGRELDPTAQAQWVATWKITPITAADDLRRLRNLYALVASGNTYADVQNYFIAFPGAQRRESCREALRSYDEHATSPPPAAIPQAQPSAVPSAHPASAITSDRQSPIGGGAGSIPEWCNALWTLHRGDSIGCKTFQRPYVELTTPQTFPFRRWLFWRERGGHNRNWFPDDVANPGTPEHPLVSLGTFGNYEIGITSRACFNDFIILVQSETPVAAEQARESGPAPSQPFH